MIVKLSKREASCMHCRRVGPVFKFRINVRRWDLNKKTWFTKRLGIRAYTFCKRLCPICLVRSHQNIRPFDSDGNEMEFDREAVMREL